MNNHMFAGSHSFSITGGTFVAGNVNVDLKGERGLLMLYQAACTSALFNAEARFPPPLCHPGTRESILDDLKTWIDSPDPSHNIRWLYGPAGAGKSAIAQTLAEICARDGVLVGTFFFWRSDSLRDNPRQLVTTIAFQLAMSILELRPIVNTVVLENPSILTSSIETQFEKLIIQPCIELRKQSRETLFSSRNKALISSRILILDGLDECLETHDQLRILSIFGNGLQMQILPFRVLIASRPEPRIKEAFCNPPFEEICLWTCLNDNFQASDDIRRYLQDEFFVMRKRHSLTMEHIPDPWPTPGQIERLVERASGQFIYPSTALKFIDNDGAVPADRLDIVLGLEESDDAGSPFANLDALYVQILSGVVEKALLLRILGILIAYQEMLRLPPMPQQPKEIFLALLRIPLGIVRATLSKLHSLFQDPSPVESGFQFCHASFSDFLLDRKRSMQFFIDLPVYHNHLAQLCLDILLQKRSTLDVNDDLFRYARLCWGEHCIAAIAADDTKTCDTDSLISKLSAFDVYKVALQVLLQKRLGLDTFDQRNNAFLHWSFFLEAIYKILVAAQAYHGVFLQKFHDISMKGFCFKVGTCRCTPQNLPCPNPEKHQECQVSIEFSSAFRDGQRETAVLLSSWKTVLKSCFEYLQDSHMYKLSSETSLSKDICPSVEALDTTNIWKVEKVLVIGSVHQLSYECTCSFYKTRVQNSDSSRLWTYESYQDDWCDEHCLPETNRSRPRSLDQAPIIGTFTVRAIGGGLLLLRRQVSTSASHDAEARYPSPRVHPGTRAKILASLERWITPKSGDEAVPIRWLYGPAEAGKTAIAQTFAEMCMSNGNTLVTTFFFSRHDPSRNNPQRLFTTIASQLAREKSDLPQAIHDAVFQDPSVLTASIEVQFDALVVQPCLRIQASDTNRILIIDGLDQCSDSHDQQRILFILGNSMNKRPLPFNRILITSRPEPDIKQSFSSSIFNNICARMPLDDTYEASRDIRLFLQDEFAKIQRFSHSRTHITLPWPTANQIEHLVEKSSGKFIYPSTVLKYIDDNRTAPVDRLNIVLGLKPDNDNSPFADLDALYRQILSVPKKQTLLVKILGAIVVSPPPLVNFDSTLLFTEILSISMRTLFTTLLGLHSVFKDYFPARSHFSFCHASFPDFLYDRKRSLQFFIDKEVHHDLLARRCLDTIFKWFPECYIDMGVGVVADGDTDTDTDSDSDSDSDLNTKTLPLHPIDAVQKYPILEHFAYHIERASGTEPLLSKLEHFDPWPLISYVGLTTYELGLKDKCIREMGYLVEAVYYIQKKYPKRFPTIASFWHNQTDLKSYLSMSTSPNCDSDPESPSLSSGQLAYTYFWMTSTTDFAPGDLVALFRLPEGTNSRASDLLNLPNTSGPGNQALFDAKREPCSGNRNMIRGKNEDEESNDMPRVQQVVAKMAEDSDDSDSNGSYETANEDGDD
ncbi:hypothetical protein D9757_014462 [Collybiopsis confluens]|uniref:NACHT domain-containing protein n=1 Tax=Collybiopsis confluens TaxID=2823264 RepID=A0A8H5CWU7_9AGAR|nr:hypothetical protein D9757_014462 [Collybiopsis confluens]